MKIVARPYQCKDMQRTASLALRNVEHGDHGRRAQMGGVVAAHTLNHLRRVGDISDSSVAQANFQVFRCEYERSRAGICRRITMLNN